MSAARERVGADMVEKTRREIRLNVAALLARGVKRGELLADLLAGARGVGHPGGREVSDGLELAQVWDDIDALSLTPLSLDDHDGAVTG